ncbi:MAG TPA: outer membrane beta-barrel protein [Methylocella sp.]
MIRRIFLASAGALALAGTAFAADLAPPPPVFLPPPPLWTGFYAGVNAGYEWSASNSVNVVSAVAFNNAATLSPLGLSYAPAAALGATRNIPLNSNGFIGGGQIGYNYQFATSWLVGIEADIDGIAGGNGTASVFTVTPRVGFAPFTVQTTDTVSKSLNYLGTVRGRFGYLLTPTLLIYGDGGLAYGGINSDTGIFGAEVPNTGTTPFFGLGRASTTRVGWTAGGGAEWMFLPNWSAKVEYAYYDLGSVTYSSGPLVTTPNGGGATSFINTAATRTHFNGNIVRAGINYHFNWGAPAPVVAKY